MEYGFANDPDMNFISTSHKYWKKIIEKYYNKYSGIAEWHEEIIRQVGNTGMYTSPFGRSYKWDLMKYGEYKIPTTQVKNYPVQGFGADVVAIARCSLFRRWQKAKIKGVLVNTVHDSLVLDVPKESVEDTKILITEVFRDLPANINRIFDVVFDLETKVEILVGHNMLELFEYKG